MSRRLNLIQLENYNGAYVQATTGQLLTKNLNAHNLRSYKGLLMNVNKKNKKVTIVVEYRQRSTE